MSQVQPYAPGSTGTLSDVIERGPELAPLTPAGPDGFKPAPSLTEMFSAALPKTLRLTPGYDDTKIGEGYAPIVDALGLPASENPGYFGDLDAAGEARFGFAGSPSRLATAARRGSQVPFGRDYLADRSIQEGLIAEQIATRRAKQPDFLPGVPADVEGLHKYFEAQQAAKRQAGGAVLARGSAFGRTAASIAAGGLESAINDPTFLPTLVIGGGTASSLLQAAARDALINGVLAAGQLPMQAHNMAENDEHLTLGEAVGQVAGAAAFGAGFGATIHLGATHVPPALFKVMPESVRTRWAARMRVGEGKQAPLLKDVLGDMDNRELATFSRSTIGRKMTPDEKGAADALERGQEIGEASPFTPGPVGDAAHNAGLADALKSVIDGVARRKTDLLASTSSVVRAPEPVAVPGDPAFGAQWAAIKGNEHGIGSHGEFLTSRKGAVGPAQVMPGTAPYAAKLAGLPWDEARYRGDPAYNEALGRAYYAEQLKTFGDPDMAAAAYNAGPGSASRGTGLRGAMRKAAEHNEPGNWEAYLPHETQRYVEDFRKRTGRAAGEVDRPVAGTGDDEIAALQRSASEAEAEGLALSRDRASAADVPVLKRELFADDQSWADAQAAFHQSLNAPEEVAGVAGAQAAEGAQRAPGAASGPFGPEFPQAAGDWPATLAALRQAKAGVVPGALDHPEIGPIDLPYGVAGKGKSDGYGLAKLEAHHPDVIARLPEILKGMSVKSRTANRIRLESADHEAAVSLEWAGNPRDAWLLTAYGKPKEVAKAPPLPVDSRGSTPLATDDERAANGGQDGSPDRGATRNIGASGALDNAALKAFDQPGGQGALDLADSLEHDARAAIAADPNAAKRTYQLSGDGKPRTLIDILDELDADAAAAKALRQCAGGGA